MCSLSGGTASSIGGSGNGSRMLRSGIQERNVQRTGIFLKPINMSGPRYFIYHAGSGLSGRYGLGLPETVVNELFLPGF